VSSLKRPKVWIAFLAIVLFFLAYSPALDGPFVFDDQRQITDNLPFGQTSMSVH